MILLRSLFAIFLSIIFQLQRYSFLLKQRRKPRNYAHNYAFYVYFNSKASILNIETIVFENKVVSLQQQNPARGTTGTNMIDFTPNHQYKEIVDSDVQAEISANKSVQIVIAIAVVASIICLFLGFQNLSWWIMIPITIIMIPVWIVALFFYALASYRPLSKAQVASIIKNVIGFDFGDDFTLLQTSSHDHEEYLYLFSESSFEPLKKHLDSIPDKDGQEGERSIKHQISVRLPTEIFPTPKAGFYLCDNRQVNGMGNIEAIEVDYQERTLKHTFTIY